MSRFLASSSPTATATEEALAADMEAEIAYGRLMTFALQPLIGLAAVSRSHEAAGTALPAWWPSS